MSQPNRTILNVNNVTCGYEGKAVLKDITLEVEDNDFIGIIGPNGGGKTTLLKLLIGEIHPFKGSIDRYGTSFGYLPQAQQIDKKFPISVMNVVLSGLLGKMGIFGRFGKAQKASAMECLHMAGIAHLSSRSIGELSGGQLQRVLLCRALISDPQLLILDEPDTYVDSKFEGELYELLEEINKHMAIIMVSHDLGTITTHVKTIACVNGTLHYHKSNHITPEQLNAYNCPIQIITHGVVPHTVLLNHELETECGCTECKERT